MTDYFSCLNLMERVVNFSKEDLHEYQQDAIYCSQAVGIHKQFEHLNNAGWDSAI